MAVISSSLVLSVKYRWDEGRLLLNRQNLLTMTKVICPKFAEIIWSPGPIKNECLAIVKQISTAENFITYGEEWHIVSSY